MTTLSFKRFSSVYLLSVLFFLLVLTACTHPRACITENASRTFVQLWRDDAKRSFSGWDQWFTNMDRLGFNEIIVQWSSYDDISFHHDARPGHENSPSLEAFIETASNHRKPIWMGLDYDPHFWQAIDVNPAGVKQYLSARMNKINQRLPILLRTIEAIDTRGDIIKGWYISDEIDDSNWKDPTRQKLLFSYLKDLRQALRKAKKDWPVLISGFANGACPAEQWTAFWNDALSYSGIEGFLFQDGIGAGKLTFDQLETHLLVLNTKLAGADHRFGVIVELFQFTPKKSINATGLQAAPFSRISRQLFLARKYSTLPITVFSAPDYLKPDGDEHCRKLYLDWQNDKRSCY
jgi:hypothetical protein